MNMQVNLPVVKSEEIDWQEEDSVGPVFEKLKDLGKNQAVEEEQEEEDPEWGPNGGWLERKAPVSERRKRSLFPAAEETEEFTHGNSGFVEVEAVPTEPTTVHPSHVKVRQLFQTFQDTEKEIMSEIRWNDSGCQSFVLANTALCKVPVEIKVKFYLPSEYNGMSFNLHSVSFVNDATYQAKNGKNKRLFKKHKWLYIDNDHNKDLYSEIMRDVNDRSFVTKNALVQGFKTMILNIRSVVYKVLCGYVRDPYKNVFVSWTTMDYSALERSIELLGSVVATKDTIQKCYRCSAYCSCFCVSCKKFNCMDCIVNEMKCEGCKESKFQLNKVCF